MNTKFCIPTKINIQKRYGSGAGGGDKVEKIVKETGKMVSPFLNNATQATGNNNPQTSSSLAQTQPNSSTPPIPPTHPIPPILPITPIPKSLAKLEPQSVPKQPTLSKYPFLRGPQVTHEKNQPFQQLLEKQKSQDTPTTSGVPLNITTSTVITEMSKGFTNVQDSKKNDSEKGFGTDTQQQTLDGVKKKGTLCQEIKDNPRNNKQSLPILDQKIMELAVKNEYTKNMIKEQNLYGFLILANILKTMNEKEITNVELAEDLKRTQEMVAYFKSQLPQNYAKDINEIKDMANIPIEYLQKYLEYLRNMENPLDTDIKLSPMLEAYIQTKLLQKSDINTDTKVRINSIASKRLYTTEDYQQQIQDALDIKAQLENPAMREIEKFDCFWNVGIIKYPNIYHKGAYLIYDSKINTEKLICYEERMIFKNGAGAKIPHKVYDDIIEYLQKNSTNAKPTTQQIDAIMDAIKNQKFFAGIFQNKDIETSILTGLDNHVSLFVEDPNNPDYAYHIGTFTSSKNEGTIQLSSRQEFNADPLEAKKVQGFRPARVLIHVNRTDIVDHADAHKFVHGYNRDNEYVPQKINLLAQKAQDFWLNHKILDNISVDLKFLQELALKKLDQIISDCTDILKKKAAYNIKRQQREEDDAKKQKENHLKKQILQQKIDSLSSTDILLFKINEELKAKIKKKIIMDSHIIPKLSIPNNDNEEIS